MPKLFIITDEWSPQPWFSTGGTRAKKYLQSPSGEFYYFKRSQYKDPSPSNLGKDFKYEFWSEVIASEVGSMLGFNVLTYDIAVDGNIMGCICQSMIDWRKEELKEGVQYLQAYSPDYDPASKEHQPWYTFQLIENALKNAKLGEEIIHIIEIIVFDSLIGNGDRHQQNWAIISQQHLIPDYIEYLEKTQGVKLSGMERWAKKIINWSIGSLKDKKLPKVFYVTDRRFAPIYDNGSSLGRELIEERMNEFLTSEENLNRYIDKGLSEIHWDGRKLNHFDLIKQLLDTAHRNIVISVIKRVIERWDPQKFETIVREVDQTVPESHFNYKIPESRKILILKMITSRKERLEKLVQ